MPLPTHPNAYEREYEYFEKAMDSAKGIRIRFDTRSTATLFALRMCTARKIAADETCRLYEPSDPRHGKSEFYKLVVRHPVEDTEGAWWVYVEPHGLEISAVEDLADLG